MVLCSTSREKKYFYSRSRRESARKERLSMYSFMPEKGLALYKVSFYDSDTPSGYAGKYFEKFSRAAKEHAFSMKFGSNIRGNKNCAVKEIETPEGRKKRGGGEDFGRKKKILERERRRTDLHSS